MAFRKYDECKVKTADADLTVDALLRKIADKYWSYYSEGDVLTT